jgi:hypothetical protein
MSFIVQCLQSACVLPQYYLTGVDILLYRECVHNINKKEVSTQKNYNFIYLIFTLDRYFKTFIDNYYHSDVSETLSLHKLSK